MPTTAASALKLDNIISYIFYSNVFAIMYRPVLGCVIEKNVDNEVFT